MSSEGICEACTKPAPSHYKIIVAGMNDVEETCPDTVPDFRTPEDIDHAFAAADARDEERFDEGGDAWDRDGVDVDPMSDRYLELEDLEDA